MSGLTDSVGGLNYGSGLNIIVGLGTQGLSGGILASELFWGGADLVWGTDNDLVWGGVDVIPAGSVYWALDDLLWGAFNDLTWS